MMRIGISLFILDDDKAVTGSLKGCGSVAAMVGVGLLGCSGAPEELPPLGEALFVVDTDAPVPGLADRLRVDFHEDDGTWIESRDISTSHVEDWPGSFSAYLDEDTTARSLIVRLRAYPEGKTRDYLGER